MIAGRAKRQQDLSRLIEGKKVEVMLAIKGHELWADYGQVNLFYVDKVFVGHGNVADDEYPDETTMAKIYLAVSATVGFEGVPSATVIDDETRARRDAYRLQMRQNLRRSEELDKMWDELDKP